LKLEAFSLLAQSQMNEVREKNNEQKVKRSKGNVVKSRIQIKFFIGSKVFLAIFHLYKFIC
jgi:hypothetical protein